MLRNPDQPKELYIPDFKLWNDYYEKKVKAQKSTDHTPQHACSSQTKEPASAVKLQFVSPVTETANQAASIMKTGKSSQKSKSKKSKVSQNKKSLKKVYKRKPKDSNKSSFSYRKLNDIFSKKKK